jgi:hypothetical protein
MAKKNHLERIKDLIKLDKSDLEIRVIIYNEYGIYYNVNDINYKRKRENTKKNIIDTKTELKFEVQLVRNVLLNNLDIPLKKNEIVQLIYENKGFLISSNEVKRILWNDLKKEIIYNTTDWTYSLRKNESVKSIDNEKVPLPLIEDLNKHNKVNLIVKLENINYKIIFIKIPERPLFSYKYTNCEYEIKINESHQIMLKEKNRELMLNVIISLIASKSEFSSLESEAMVYKFLNKFDAILNLK